MLICSNCGAKVPFNGNVCPLCKADKTNDQLRQGMAWLGGIVAVAPVFLFGIVTDHYMFAFVGGIVAMAIGMGAGWALAEKRTKILQAKQCGLPVAEPEPMSRNKLNVIQLSIALAALAFFYWIY